MNIQTNHQTKLHSNQSGQAAIFITLILMLVMGIIALAISQIVSRNTRNAFNYQEGIQANYAAESGINDATYALGQNPNLPTSDSDCTTFTNAVDGQIGLSSSLSNSPKIAYTCLTANSHPSTLEESVTDTQSTVTALNISPATSSLVFTWPSGGSVANCTTSTLQFVNQADWISSGCSSPILRVDIFDNITGHTYNNAQALENDTLSFFFFPTNSGSGISPGISFSGAQPAVYSALCNSSTCSETLSIPATYSAGYVRLTSVYGNIPGSGYVTIGGIGSGSHTSGGQIPIDSTGIDQDEIQRIEVRVNANASSAPAYAPNYAADAGWAFCKRFVETAGHADPDVTNQNPWFLCGNALKPAIYLYPTVAEQVNVKVSYPTGLKTTIPSYNANTGWNVFAQPDGNLKDLADGKNYPYLYWEGNEDSFNFDMSKGFVVPGEDTAAFLKKELKIIGLNQNEIAGFLQYWVPKMKDNPYSLIHFAGSEYTKMAPLTITPKPDSMLRVFMAEESISRPVVVTPQTFPTFHRTGFTVVEWGGSVLN